MCNGPGRRLQVDVGTQFKSGSASQPFSVIQVRWYGTPAGLTFHGDAAELLAACGDEAGARAQIAAGERRADSAQFPHMLQRGRAAIAARYDPPDRSGGIVDGNPRGTEHPADRSAADAAAPRPGVRTGRRRFRMRNRGQSAFAAAATLDHPGVLAAAEPELALWAADLLGAPCTVPARGLLFSAGCRSFETASDMSPPPGLPQLVVGLLAVKGAQSREALVDLLWPDVDLHTGLPACAIS